MVVVVFPPLTGTRTFSVRSFLCPPLISLEYVADGGVYLRIEQAVDQLSEGKFTGEGGGGAGGE